MEDIFYRVAAGNHMAWHNFMLDTNRVADRIDIVVHESCIILCVEYSGMEYFFGVEYGDRKRYFRHYDFTEEQDLVEFFNFIGASIKSLTLHSHKSFCRINDILPMDSVTMIYDDAPGDEPFVFQLKSMRSLFWIENLRGARISVDQNAVFPSLEPDLLETPPFNYWVNKKREKIFNVVISTKKLGSFKVPFAKMLLEMM